MTKQRGHQQVDYTRDAASVLPIKKAICAACYIDMEELESRSREAELVDARSIGYLLARELIGLSYPRLGRVFAKDHTTILNGVRRAEAKAMNDKTFNAMLGAVMQRIPEMEEV